MKKNLPKEVKKAWFLSNFLKALFALICLLISNFMINRIFNLNYHNLIFTIVNVILVFYLLLNIIQILLIPYIYNFWTYQINAEFIEITKGFFFKRTITIPLARLQTITFEDGPILRWQHLTEFKIHTASSSESIEGITLTEAKKFRAQLLKIIKKTGEKDA